MPAPLLLVITGPSGSGKTTLAQRLAADFQLPLLYKDAIKERLFDDLGWSDRAWSRKLGIATYTLLYYFLEVQLAAGISCIIESNFLRKFANPKFLALQAQYGFQPFQIQCFADGEILLRRFKERAESNARHPGHVEQANYAEFESHLLQGFMDPLDIGGTLYPLNTTNFAMIDYKKLYAAIQAVLSEKS